MYAAAYEIEHGGGGRSRGGSIADRLLRFGQHLSGAPGRR